MSPSRRTLAAAAQPRASTAWVSGVSLTRIGPGSNSISWNASTPAVRSHSARRLARRNQFRTVDSGRPSSAAIVQCPVPAALCRLEQGVPDRLCRVAPSGKTPGRQEHLGGSALRAGKPARPIRDVGSVELSDLAVALNRPGFPRGSGSPRPSTLRSDAGSTTTEPSTTPSCTSLHGASTSIWFDRWAMRGFKRLKDRPSRAWAWLNAVIQREPRRFAPWWLVSSPNGRPVGAG